ncbi:MAG: ATP-dependent 6-phosphofructokinase [Rubrivivax sp.]|jgi:6-phosphofructokinase 1|nr:ATP-dependent 6-phosphofructokinase [Rubrivivax sp.]
MHIGLLTGGGDCPGLNAVIRAVALALMRDAGARVSGIRRGFLGLMDNQVQPLSAADVQGIVAQGGTILGTHNRCDPFHDGQAGGADRSDIALQTLDEHRLDALVVIGGDGTMAIAHRFAQRGVPVVGVPKTIDNDLLHTERSFGFDSAVSVVAESLGRLETTARSHGRVMIAETMGRYAGWIALEAGLAGAADVIAIPERELQLDALLARCDEQHASGGCTLISIAEGVSLDGQLSVQQTLADSPDPLRLGGVGMALQRWLQPQLRAEVRSVQLGHVQRGGTPTAFDRVLATRFGWQAAQLVQRGQFGRMVALQGDTLTDIALQDVAQGCRRVPPGHPLVQTAASLGVLI